MTTDTTDAADTTAGRYTVKARTAGDGTAEITAHSTTLTFDRAWPNTEQPTLPGPGELLAAAFAACAIKNVERFSRILPFAYDAAEIDVELHREDHPSRFDRVDYVLRLVTDEPAARVDLLARNLAKHGTVYNTLAAGCEITGRIETTPRTRSETPGTDDSSLLDR